MPHKCTNDEKEHAGTMAGEQGAVAFPSSFPTMPKGRKSKKVGRKKKPASYGKKKNHHSPISAEQMSWEFVRAIPTEETKVVCDGEGCNKAAIGMWETKTAPAKIWNGCEQCQTTKFGDWRARVNMASGNTVAAAKFETTQGSIACTRTSSASSANNGKSSSAPVEASKEVTRDTLNQQPTAEVSLDKAAEESSGEVITPQCLSFNEASVKEPTEREGSVPNDGKDGTSVSLEDNQFTPVPSKKSQARVKSGGYDSVKAIEANGEAGTDSHEEEEEEEEGWDLVKILTERAFTKSQGQICTTDGCDLPACLLYASDKNPKSKWYCCLDCQEDDFGGWPESLEEIPVKHLTKKHMRAMEKHCSRRPAPRPMPDFDNISSSKSKSGGAKKKEGAKADDGSSANIPAPQQQSGKKRGHTVTPSPHPPAAILLQKSALAFMASSPPKVLHTVWQKGSEEIDIPEPKIVVQQPCAKRLKDISD